MLLYILEVFGTSTDFVTETHKEDLIDILQKQAAKGEYLDLRIKVEDQIFSVHKLVMKSYSMYLRNIIEANQNEGIISLENICTPEIFDVIIGWMYAKKENAMKDLTYINAVAILAAAKKLDVKSLMTQSNHIIKQALSHNYLYAIHYMREAKKFQLSALKEQCKSKIAMDFMKIVKSEEFLDFSFEDILVIISNNHLNVPGEKLVFEAACSWLLYDYHVRKNNVEEVMSKIRFGLMSPLELVEIRNLSKYEKIFQHPVVNSNAQIGLNYAVSKEALKGQPEKFEDFLKEHVIQKPRQRSHYVC